MRYGNGPHTDHERYMLELRREYRMQRAEGSVVDGKGEGDGFVTRNATENGDSGDDAGAKAQA